jgi:predicted translation initiation factor SUI1
MGQRGSKRVLFLCTGNYYRSRFAEGLFNGVAARMGLPWRASSAGLALERGIDNVGPMAESAIEALEALRCRGAECERPPASVTAEELERADLIIALSRDEHLPLLQERHPGWAEKVEYWGVEDAPGVLPRVERQVHQLLARLMGGGQAPPADVPPAPREPPRRDVTVRVGRETKGRRGKGVTTVGDLPLDEAGLRGLAALLKQKCGTGGTVKDGRIEIQGDHRDRLAAELERMGYRVRRSGG